MFVSEFHNEEEEPIYPHGPLRLPIDDNIKVQILRTRCCADLLVPSCLCVRIFPLALENTVGSGEALADSNLLP